MSNRMNLILMLVVIVLFGSVAWGQQIQWLQYHTAREARNIVGAMGLQTLTLSQEKPSAIPLPEFTNEQPLFARWSSPMAKGGHLWLALDRSHQNGPYDRLFIDSNGDGALKDEDAITAYRTDVYYANFGPVKVVFQGEDGPITYHLIFECYNTVGRKDLRVYAGGWYEGEIKVGQEKKKCLLIDHNANGTFNDKSLDPRQCDRIRIGNETRYVGKYLEINGMLCEPEIAPDGAYIKLVPAINVTYGKVRVPDTIAEIAAGGANGLFTLKPTEGEAQLPTGKYRINRWIVERQDEQGRPWKLESTNNSDHGDFEVNLSTETSIKVGEPVISTLMVSTPNKTTYSFNQSLKGRLGEVISITRNGIRPQPPKVHIKRV